MEIHKFQFKFHQVSSGAYNVTFTTGRGDYYIARINYMPIIDATYHEERPRQKSLKELARLCRYHGEHYNKHGQIINL